MIVFVIFYRLFEEAAQACYDQRDIISLYTVHNITSKSKDHEVNRKVEDFIAALSEKK